jgi:Spy/CpxP family protein refolding chaperone
MTRNLWMPIGAVLLGAILTFASPAGAQPPKGGPAPGGPRPGGPPGGPRPGAGQGMDRFAAELGLTNDQKAKLKAIVEDQRKQAQAVVADKSLKDDQRQTKLRGLFQGTQAKIRKLLTPAQQKKFDDMQAQMRERMRQRGSAGGPGAPAPPGGKR